MNCEDRAMGLWQRLERPRQNVAAFDRWLRSPWYVVTLAVLTAISSLLGLDLVIYSLFMGLGIFVSLFGSDLLPLMPIFILCYVAPSRENNPGRYPGSVFYPLNGGIYLGLLLALFAGCLVWRLVKDPKWGGGRDSCKPSGACCLLCCSLGLLICSAESAWMNISPSCGKIWSLP